MITLEVSGLFPELATTMVVDGSTILVIVGEIEQKRHEISGLMVETMQLTAVALEFGPVAVGQEVEIDGVLWEVEAVRRESSLVVVSLMRNLG